MRPVRPRQQAPAIVRRALACGDDRRRARRRGAGRAAAAAARGHRDARLRPRLDPGGEGDGRLAGLPHALPATARAELTAARLRGAGAVVFLNTSGDLHLDGAGRRRLLAYVRDGGAFVGAHAAADTFADWPAFHRMLGADFLGHAPARAAPPTRIDVVDHAFTTLRTFADRRRVLSLPGPRQAPCRGARARRRPARLVAALRARARVLRRAGPLPGDVERAPPAPAHGRRHPLGARARS